MAYPLSDISLNQTMNIEPKLLVKMNDIVSENSCFCVRMGNLFCIPCNEPFGKINEKTVKDTVKKHIKSDKHQKNIGSKKRKSTDDLSLYSVTNDDLKLFFFRLTFAFMAADIPLEKLKNDVLKTFLQDYTGKKIPDPSTLRNNHVSSVYSKLLVKARKVIGLNSKIYIMVDETKDLLQRTIFSMLVGVLNGEVTKPILFSTQILHHTDALGIVTAMKKDSINCGLKGMNRII